MAFSERDLSTYIDVAQRIADFRERYPEGVLRPLNPNEPYRLVQADGIDKDGTSVMQSFVVVVAAAYRSPSDDCPGVGMAWEIFPGRTPYTRGSELQNAETSAWGRAIIAVGASDSKAGIASREEVRNRQAERFCHFPHCTDPVHCRCKSCHDAGSNSLFPDLSQPGAQQLIDQARALRNAPPEVDEHGAATVAEQTRMSTGREPGTHRSSTSDPQWYDAPAPLADLTNPEDRHGTATADQIRSLQAAFASKGIANGAQGAEAIRAAKMAWLVKRFGPDIHSSKDLSYTQAAAALQELAR